MPDGTGVERADTASATDAEVVPEAHGTSGGRADAVRKLSNWPLRNKVVAVFLLPTVVALFLAGLRIVDGIEDASVYDRALARIELSQRVAALVHEVQGERIAMAAWIVSGRPNDRRALDRSIAKTNAAAQKLRAAQDLVEEIDDPATTELYKQALNRLESLSQLRSAASAPDFPVSAVVASYNVLVDTLLELSDKFGAQVTDRGLQRRHEALSALAHAKEYSARQNTYLRIAAIRGGFRSTELQALVRARSQLVSAIAAFNEAATPAHQNLYRSHVSGSAVSTRVRLQTLALQRARSGQPLAISPTTVNTSSTTTLQNMFEVQKELLADAENYTANLLSDVRRQLILTSLLLLVSLLAALAVTLVVARSLLRPLRRLRTNALEVADRHLPEAVDRIMRESDPREAAERAIDPVPVHTEEEVGQVARAFDVVHDQAVRLAAEQALLRENVNGIFVNLSRRSQRLVERQLGVIDRLESDEQDPDQLASLFELDHLATRLRRNGESLLVLSGAGLSKSLSRPVPAADVLGAAVSEIEQYSRVEIGSMPQVAVRGTTVHDLIHLLAELFDNATYFSEPGTNITVRAVVTRRNALAIQITDRGVGMSEEQVTEANERLADPPDLDVSVTRRMGLYVVARLAQRHDIEVRLRENEDIEGGIIARIVVPQSLLEDISTAEPSLTPPPDNRPKQQPTAGGGEQELGEFTPIPAYTQDWSASNGTGEPTPSAPRSVDAGSVESWYSAPEQPRWPQEETTVNGTQSQLPDPTPADPIPADPTPADPAGEDGLAPLDQPISLDDLVSGTSAAGPFIDPEPDPGQDDLPPPRDVAHRSSGVRSEEPDSAPDADGVPDRDSATATGDGAARSPETESRGAQFTVPRAQPQYVPGGGDEHLAAASTGAEDAAALEDDVPTKRLPIYQSVVSRWFSEQETPDPNAAEPQDPYAAGTPEQSQGVAVAQDWSSSSDEGWQAAESLLQTGDEETTGAGLPKRVPNAYLVPGSVQADPGSESPGFTDTTSAHPGQGAIARSADAARTRMMNFQRGYTRGRHALTEDGSRGGDAETLGKNVVGERSTENGVKE